MIEVELATPAVSSDEQTTISTAPATVFLATANRSMLTLLMLVSILYFKFLPPIPASLVHKLLAPQLTLSRALLGALSK
jgi:hypothetical protein